MLRIAYKFFQQIYKFRNSLQKTNCKQFEMANNTRTPRIDALIAHLLYKNQYMHTQKPQFRKNENDIEFRKILKRPHHGHQSKTLITIF